MSDPLVRMEKGLAKSRSASRMPGMSRYLPSARWYGSTFVPMAMCSPFHDFVASSFRRRSAALTFTTIFESKSSPESRSR